MNIPGTNRLYHLQSKATGFFLFGVENDESAKTVMATDSFGTGTIWRLDADFDIFYNLVHEQSGLRLDSNQERQVYILPGNGGTYQSWRMHDGGEGYWVLKNLATSLALDGNTDHDIYTTTENGGSYQAWKFLPI